MKAKMLMFGAALTVGFAAGAPAVASAQDIFSNIFSAIGLTPKEQDPIDYRERAPLVVPPKSDLREPQQRAGDRNAAWPNDPDVAARRRAAAERNKPVIGFGTNDVQTLRPGELRSGPRTATNRYDGKPLGARLENDNTELMINPARDLRAVDAQRQQSLTNLRPGEEPERRSLAEPPTGYRRPTDVVRTAQDPIQDKDSSDARSYVREQRRN